MKKIITIFSFLFLYSAQAAMLPENTVAVVNGMAITQEEFDYTLKKLLPNVSFHVNIKKEKTDELEKEALDKLIDIAIFYTYGVSQGLKATKKELDDRKNKLLEIADNSEVKLAIYMAELKVTTDFYMLTYNKELVLGRVYEKYIKSIPTDEDLKQYYEKNKYKFKIPEKINVKMIYVQNNPMDPEGNIKAKDTAEEALSKIKSGTPFEVVAEKYSSDPSRVKGGHLGMLHRGQLIYSIEAEVFNMKVGELSGVMERALGCYIVEVIEKGEADQLPFNMVKDQLRKDLKVKQEAEKRDNLLRNLKKKAKILK